MGILDLNQSNLEENKQTTETTPVETTPQPQERTVVLDGPLSSIYAEALNVVYHYKPDETISHESAANDTLINTKLAAVLTQQAEDELKEKDTCYIYVTDNGKVEDSLPGVFETLSVALGKDCYKEHIVAIEQINNKVGKNQSLLVDYLSERGVKVFFSKAPTLRHLKR